MRRILLSSLLAASLSCGSNSSTNYKDLANKCQAPRHGLDPITGQAYPDLAGSDLLERQFLKGWSDDTYLWYSELPNPDPKSFAHTTDYFNALRTSAKTSSGANKDKFHFFYDTLFWESLSQSGVEAGYGVTFALVSRSPPRLAYVAYTEPGSPAVGAGLTRGTQIVTVDNEPVVDG